MQDKKVFLIIFVVAGFVMKVASEVVHEVFGHGSFVLLFGGQITGVDISLTWPYDFSYIHFSAPNGITSAQAAWIFGGGILVCLCLSFLIQAFLFVKRKMVWYFDVALFWLAFWTLINSTGYLLIGGIKPFGDVNELIRLGVLTSFTSLSIGFAFFVIGFVALSWILRRLLLRMFTLKRASFGVSLFWLLIPLLISVMMANPERGLPWTYLPLAFLPSLLSFIIEYFFVLSKQQANANPDNIAEK